MYNIRDNNEEEIIMIFWFLISVWFILVVGVFFGVIVAIITSEEGWLGVSGTSIFFGVILSAALGVVWSNHADDLAKISHQEQIIEVQRDRIKSLSSRLSDFDFPDKSRISLDSDSPWASIIGSISDAENSLARAKTERAEAIRSVESRRVGPMSGVVTFVGDYK